MPGTTYRPLERRGEVGKRSEVQRFREAAKKSPPRDEVIGLTALDSGMRGVDIAHMNGSWLNTTGRGLEIDVPPYQKCRLGNGTSGSGGDTTEKGEPCYDCKDRNVDRNWAPDPSRLPDSGDCYLPKTEAGYKGRMIPIKNDHTAQVLISYFKIHDYLVTRDAVGKAIKRVAKRADIFEKDGGTGDRDWPTTHALRDTYGTRLAEMDFTRDEIKEVMGHKTIIPADDYIRMSGKKVRDAFDEKYDEI